MTVQYEDPEYLEAVYAALFEQLKTAQFAGGLKLASSQRTFVAPSEIPEAEQPCLMLIPGPIEAVQKEFSLTKWTPTAVAVLVFRADGSSDQSPKAVTQANYFIWGLQAALQTAPACQKQTLDDLVYHTWVEGHVYPEIQDQQVVITLPIFILLGPVG